MALSDVTKAVAPVGAVAPTVKAPVVGGNAPVSKGKGKTYEEFLNKGKMILASRKEEERQIEGSKSDKVVFIAALGDPAKKQNRVEGKKDIPSYKPVGYAFKALEDMKIPRADLKQKFSSLMDVEPVAWEEVKAGETFYLNLAETGMLISKPEFAGTFTGEGTGVRVTVTFSQDRETPNIALKNIDGGSVKKNMILIAFGYYLSASFRCDFKGFLNYYMFPFPCSCNSPLQVKATRSSNCTYFNVRIAQKLIKRRIS